MLGTSFAMMTRATIAYRAATRMCSSGAPSAGAIKFDLSFSAN
jgi:hypothetical protein